MQNRIHHLLRDRTFWGVLTHAAPISHGLGGRAEHRSIAKAVKRKRKEVAGAWGGGCGEGDAFLGARGAPAAEGHAALRPEATHTDLCFPLAGEPCGREASSATPGWVWRLASLARENGRAPIR